MGPYLTRPAFGSPLSTALLLMAAALLTGCVTPLPLAQETPRLSYKVSRPMTMAVIDERDALKEGKPPTYIGRVHVAFGIPVDMQTYPWLISDKAKKEQTLAQALEERVILGLNDQGWQLTAGGFSSRPMQDAAVAVVAKQNAQRLVMLSITQWFVSVNTNWVTAFNFDWGYKLEVLDTQGNIAGSITDSGRDVVDAKANDSYQNLIKLAYRDRLVQILERPEVRAVLEQ